MASRRPTRSTTKRRYDNEESGGEVSQPHYDISQMSQMMGGMNMAMGMGGLQGLGYPPVEGYYNIGHQYHHQYQQPIGSFSQVEYPEAMPGSSRTLRTRLPAMPPPSASIPSSSGTQRGRRGGASTSQVAGSLHSQAQESGGEDNDDDDEVEEAVASTSASAKSKKGASTSTGTGMETTLTVDQMVQNCLYYLLLNQNKKVPVKRSDLVKNAMNSQHKQFLEVMKKLEQILDDVFGMSLYRLGKGKDDAPVSATAETAEEEVVAEEAGAAAGKKGRGKGSSSAASYMLISKYPSSVCDSVTKRDPEADSKKTVLYLTLTLIFMLNRPIDEEQIWRIIHEMKLDQMVCEKRDDLRKFIKSEFVSPGYLNMELDEQHSARHAATKPPGEHDLTGAKYSWGPRAQMEYYKYPMLKFVTSRFPGRQPYEFTVQYNVCRKKEKDLIDKELVEEKDSDEENNPSRVQTDGENGSALHIRKKATAAGSSTETYSIDGDNTETEPE